MKKLLSIVLVITMLLTLCILPVYAETETDVNDYKYYDKVIELNYGEDPWCYQEIYYHYSDDDSEEPEWTFIECVTDLVMWDCRFGIAVEDIIIFNYDTGSISDNHYLVYVTALDEFLRVDSRDIDKIMENCPDFVEKMKEQKLCALRGDINDDFEVDIIDATYAQRFVAGYNDSVSVRNSVSSDIRSYHNIREEGYVVSIDHENNYKWKYLLLLDYDYDGEVTILDATAIQLKLAEVE